MKAVLDTNVVISGLLSPHGPCGRILDLVLDGQIRLGIDARIFAEYTEVAHRPRLAIPSPPAERVLTFIHLLADPVTARPLAIALPDIDDLPFLEVANAFGAVLVTGNKRHYPPALCRDVAVYSPAEFLEAFGTELE